MAKWNAADLPDLTGRTMLVTGASSGIGLITARELGRVGAQVVLGVRDPQKARRAIEGLPGTYQVRRLDVADLASVREFAGSWKGPLDVLINNAGVMDVPAARTADGLDLETATNYTGPFVLTQLLLPHITDRVVSVTSQLHRQAKLDVDDLDWRGRQPSTRSLQAYKDSKFAQILFSLELQRRLSESGSSVRSMLAHPGIARTGLVDHSWSRIIMWLGPLLNDAERGALPTLFAATQDLPGNSYVGPRGLGSMKGHPAVRRPSRRGRDGKLAARLWTATEALTHTSARV